MLTTLSHTCALQRYFLSLKPRRLLPFPNLSSFPLTLTQPPGFSFCLLQRALLSTPTQQDCRSLQAHSGNLQTCSFVCICGGLKSAVFLNCSSLYEACTATQATCPGDSRSAAQELPLPIYLTGFLCDSRSCPGTSSFGGPKVQPACTASADIEPPICEIFTSSSLVLVDNDLPKWGIIVTDQNTGGKPGEGGARL